MLHRENLDETLAGLGFDPSRFPAGELDELSLAWHFLPPWPAGVLGLAAGEVMLAAAHEGDLGAARAAGLATAFVARPLERGAGAVGPSGPDGDWDLAVTSITKLAALLVR